MDISPVKNIPLTGNRKVVYTAIYNDYDPLFEPKLTEELCDIDLICFTDNPKLRSTHWTVIYLPQDESPVKAARRVKICYYDYLWHYDQSVWIDARFSIKGSLEYLFKKYIPEGVEMTMLNHWDRSCLFKEAEELIRLGRGNKKDIERQVVRYTDRCFPKEYGLWATGIMFRDHRSPAVKLLCETWWREVNFYSSRDQISFPYVRQNVHIKLKTIDIKEMTQSYFTMHNHIK